MKVLLLLQITAVTLLLSNCQNKFPEIDPNHSKNPITTISFGSCNRQTLAQPLWQPITENKPDLWIWLGDNIYGDTDTMAVMRAKYDLQKANTEYQKLTSTTPIIGIWDDHDYGRNDAGKGYLMKKESKNLMLEFLGEPTTSERRMHEGAYHSYTYGPIDKQVKVILLDARYFRDTIIRTNGVYAPNETGTVLGAEQWMWLEKELLNSKASVNLIGCGIQMIPAEHRFEKWANFPKERSRLFDLIAKTKVKGTILLSGDRHISEISKFQHEGMSYPIYEVTSSGLTHSATNNLGEANSLRVGKLINVLSFGLMKIDWTKKPLQVNLELRGLNNALLDSHQIVY